MSYASKEIVEVLRGFSDQLVDNFEWRAPILNQAAKKIEELEARIDILNISNSNLAEEVRELEKK